MASIDRHQYSEEIRKGAAKFVKDLNLDTGQSSYVPRKSSLVNGGDSSGMLKKVSNSLSSKLEYFQKLDRESVSSNSPRRVSTTSLANGAESRPAVGSKVNRSSIGAIASFALGDNETGVANGSVGTLTKVTAKAESTGVSKGVTPLSRLPGQDLNISELVSVGNVVTSNGVHTAQVALVTNGHTQPGIYSRQSSVDKVKLYCQVKVQVQSLK